MEKIVISNYDCLVVNGDEQIFLQAGQRLNLNEDCILSIYPTKPHSPAFCLNTEATEDCEKYKVFDGEQKIFYLIDGTTCSKFQIYTTMLLDSPCEIELGQNKIVIKFLQYKREISLDKSYEKYACTIEASFANILLTNKNMQTLVTFNGKNGTVEIFEADEIKFTSSGFLTTKNIDDIARHIIKKEYIFSDENIIERNAQIDYQSGRPVSCTAAQTIPYAFLQAIEIGDFELALNYLSISMRRRVDRAHLQQFFGKIKYFFPISLSDYAVISQSEKNIYSFLMEDEKIIDIDKK